jgi:hypothetical protein
VNVDMLGEPRDYRQFVGWPALLPVGPCFTSKGVFGRCMSFRQCYPYFKLPELSNWDTWVLGMYDTCSYFTSSGRQVRTISYQEPWNLGMHRICKYSMTVLDGR